MNAQDEQFLNLRTFPARIRVEQAALLLGFSVHEIPILTAHGLIKPLGHPLPTGVKFFSVAALEELRKDEKWLARASDCIVQYWKEVNRRRKTQDDGSHRPNQHQSTFSNIRSARRFENATE